MDHERDEYLLAGEVAGLLGGVTAKTVGRWAMDPAAQPTSLRAAAHAIRGTMVECR